MSVNATDPPVTNGNGEPLFVAQGERPASLEPLDFAALTPFHRALLVIDGTVTQFIEAFTLEHVHVICFHQERRTLPADHRWLDAPKDAPVLFRQVLLRGAESKTLYVTATSLIAVDRLTEEMRQGVLSGEESLGRLLRKHRVETHRELLWYGLSRSDDLNDASLRREGEAYVNRTYRMISAGQPIMLITENFPVDVL